MLVFFMVYLVLWTLAYIHGCHPRDVKAGWIRILYSLFLFPIALLAAVLILLIEIYEEAASGTSNWPSFWKYTAKSWIDFYEEFLSTLRGPEHDQ